MHTHYDNLKVTRGAPAEVIRAAYKALSQRYHPDRNPNPDAQRIMRIINDAYAVLGDPDRRMAYDRELAAKDREAPKVQGPATSASAPSAAAAAEAQRAAAPGYGNGARAEPSWFGSRTAASHASAAGGQTARDATAAHSAATKKPRLPRTILFVLAVLIGLCAAWIWHANLRRTIDARLASNTVQGGAASTTWTNPVTQAVATIDGIWKLSVTGADTGQPIYTFTETNGSAAIVFAREDLPDVGFDRYIPAYIHNNAHTMPLGAPGIRETVDGHESWSTDGHLVAAPNMKTHVELRHIGSSFWRLVIVQAQPYRESDDATQALRAQLWATLAGL